MDDLTKESLIACLEWISARYHFSPHANKWELNGSQYPWVYYTHAELFEIFNQQNK